MRYLLLLSILLVSCTTHIGQSYSPTPSPSVVLFDSPEPSVVASQTPSDPTGCCNMQCTPGSAGGFNDDKTCRETTEAECPSGCSQDMQDWCFADTNGNCVFATWHEDVECIDRKCTLVEKCCECTNEIDEDICFITTEECERDGFTCKASENCGCVEGYCEEKGCCKYPLGGCDQNTFEDCCPAGVCPDGTTWDSLSRCDEMTGVCEKLGCCEGDPCTETTEDECETDWDVDSFCDPDSGECEGPGCCQTFLGCYYSLEPKCFGFFMGDEYVCTSSGLCELDVPEPTVTPGIYITPVASPPPPKLAVVIDSGHGGSNVGVVGNGGLVEKDVNLAIGLKLKALFSNDARYDVYMTRDKEAFVANKKRADYANGLMKKYGFKKIIFISIHQNMKVGCGTETIIEKIGTDDKSKYSQILAGYVQNALWPSISSYEKSLYAKPENKPKMDPPCEKPNRGVKTIADLKRDETITVLTNTRMPAALAEVVFMNKNGELMLRSSYFQTMVATKIKSGIDAYFSSAIA